MQIPGDNRRSRPHFDRTGFFLRCKGNARQRRGGYESDECILYGMGGRWRR